MTRRRNPDAVDRQGNYFIMKTQAGKKVNRGLKNAYS